MKNRTGMILAFVALLAVFFFVIISGSEDKASEAAAKPSIVAVPLDAPLYKEGELLVQFRPTVGQSAVIQANSVVGATTMKDLGRAIELVKLPPGMSVTDAMAQYESNPVVASVSPNYLRSIKQTVPDDTLFGFLWGMNNTGQTGGTIDADIDAPEAWDLTTGDSNVIIAVVDTGVDYTHPDLVDNMWRNLAELTGVAGVDDDGNGYIDDIFGIDTVNNDSDPMDDFGHGTHVAGTIGAVGNNAMGVAGVNWNVQIMALKFISGTTGTGSVADEIEALNYVADMANRGEKVVAVNASYGGYLPDFTFEATAINNLRTYGILFIAAAGNDAFDNDALFHYPSSYALPNLISVAATDDNDQLASFSNSGRRTVHVGAPGVNIVSTLWAPNAGDPLYGDFEVPWSGTSMATPHVSGVVGLLYALFPGVDPVTGWPGARNRILASGDLDQYLVAKTMTGRRLNAFNALTCSNSEILARIRPSTSEAKTWLDPTGTTILFTIIPQRNDVTAIFAEDNFGTLVSVPLRLSALHINCADPAGNVVVNIGGQNMTLLDDGAGPFDLVAGDGVYSGSWSPPLNETDITARFPNTGTSIGSTNDTFTIHVRKSDDPSGNVVADAGRDMTVEEGADFRLDGSISSGNPNSFSPLLYEWAIDVPGLGVLSLTDTETPFPSGIASLGGESSATHIVKLTVTDLSGNQATDTVTIRVVPAGGGGGGSSCFIATAAYGSADEQDVVLLRQFRDRYLLTNLPGRAFVRLYYEYSPPMAAFISTRPVVRKAVMIGLTPVVACAHVALVTTTLEKLLIGAVFALLFVGLLGLLRVNHRRALRQSDVG